MTAPAFAPALTLSVSGIAPEPPTIIVSPGYVSLQALMIRIIAFVLAGMRRRNPLVEYVASETSLFGKFAE
jgi:hypothetical protein